jgi:hypothetical protein
MKKILFTSILILFSAFASLIWAQSYTSELYLDTPEKLADEFFSQYSDSNLPTLEDGDYLGESFSWNTSNWLSFYLRMHQLTKNSFWLDRADTSIQFMFDHTDEQKYLRGELSFSYYSQAPYYVYQVTPFQPHIGWSRIYDEEVRAEVLIDGNICKHIMMVADYMKTNGFDEYDTDSYISKCLSIISTHDSSFIMNRYTSPVIDGAYYYPSTERGGYYSSPVPFNHNGVTAEAAMLIYKYTGDTGMLEIAQKVRDFYLRYFTQIDDHYLWSYMMFSDGTFRENEDVNHGSYDAHFLYTLWKEGQLADSVMAGMANTVPVFLTESSCAHSIDGTGTSDDGDWVSVSYGYLDIAFAMNRDDIMKTIIKSVSYAHSTDMGLWSARYRSIADVLVIDMLRLNDSLPENGVFLSYSAITLDPSDTWQLVATDDSVTWSSSNASVATVDSTGLITAVSPGSTTITVTTNDEGYTTNCLVTVNEVDSNLDFEGYAVSASSIDGENVPLNTRDSDLDTRWSASGDGEWIKFDMQQTRIVDNLEIAFLSGDARTTSFDIQISSDDINWATLYSGSSSGTSLDLETFDFTNTSGRYIRILGHGNSVSDWNSITEIKINLVLEVGITSQDFDDKEIKLYPNPTINHNFTIDLTNYSYQKEFEIYITDITGRVVYHNIKPGGYLHQVNAIQSKGLYNVHIETSDLKKNLKLIIN